MKILSLTTIVATLMTSVLARSSVYMVNSDNVKQMETKPEVSMNAFSMFYSHMMDSASNHPALLLQDAAQKEAIQGAQKIAPFLPQSNDIFTKKVNANLMVIISGVQSPQDILSTHDTSFYVSDDESESYSSLAQDTFEQMNNDDVTVTTYKNQKTEIRRGEEIIDVASRLPEESFEYFKRDFAHLDTSAFDIKNEADKMFVAEVEDVREIYSSGRKYEPSDMRVVEINTLETLAQEYGLDSKQYKEAHLVLRDLFEKFVIPNFQQLYNNNGAISTLILTPIVKQQNERRDFKINRLVAPAVGDTCFKTLSACKNGTADCSGNGQCTQIEVHCFTCQCKSSSYIGESCQYIDAVSDFQLLFWTSVLLIVVTASVVVCVYQSGNIVDGGIIMAQSLPKQD